MAGKKQQLTEQKRLYIERMPEMELQKTHLWYINRCMKYDLWKDITHTEAYMMREALGSELRIRMSAI